MGKVLEHSHLAHKMFRNFASGEDRALAQLCIVMDGPEETETNTELHNHSDKHYLHGAFGIQNPLTLLTENIALA